MAQVQFLHRELRLALDRQLGPDGLVREFAQFSRRVLADYVATQEAPPTWETYVNGRTGLPEEAVRLPGPIIYVFSHMRVIARETLDWLARESPRKSGAYARSHFVLHNGSQIEPGRIPPNATEITITNDQPYARKIHVGAMKTSAPPYIFEEARQMVLAKYGNVVEAQVRFLSLAGAWKIRRGPDAGKQVTYPAVVITAKDI